MARRKSLLKSSEPPVLTPGTRLAQGGTTGKLRAHRAFVLFLDLHAGQIGLTDDRRKVSRLFQ
jgi:hypothetical protein